MHNQKQHNQRSYNQSSQNDTRMTRTGTAAYIMDFLGLVLKMTAGLYILFMGIALPFYFHPETDYTTIGTGKSQFFHKWGFDLARVCMVALAIYLICGLICLALEEKNKKGSIFNIVKEWWRGISLTDKFALLYFLTLVISYILTNYKDFARMGASGWFMGFWPQTILVGSYFILSGVVSEKMAKIALGLMVLASDVVFVLGILNRYGINPLGMTQSGPAFISTIGNINWYCGYWAVLCPLACALFVFAGEAESKQGAGHGRNTDGDARWEFLAIFVRIFLGLSAMIGYATGITQGSDSGLLTLAGLILILGLLAGYRSGRFVTLLFLFATTTFGLHLLQTFFPDRNQYLTTGYHLLVTSKFSYGALLVLGLLLIGLKMPRFRELFYRFFRPFWKILVGVILLVLGVGVILLVCNTLKPGSIGPLSENPLFVFNNRWGSSRGATWKFGYLTWASQDMLHKWIGVGPDCMAIYIQEGPDVALQTIVRDYFGNSRLTNAHGEWLTVLVNTGILGLVGFAGMIVSAIIGFIKQNKSILTMACGVAIFCYSVNNIFSFETTMNTTQLYIILGIGAALIRKKES